MSSGELHAPNGRREGQGDRRGVTENTAILRTRIGNLDQPEIAKAWDTLVSNQPSIYSARPIRAASARALAGVIFEGDRVVAGGIFYRSELKLPFGLGVSFVHCGVPLTATGSFLLLAPLAPSLAREIRRLWNEMSRRLRCRLVICPRLEPDNPAVDALKESCWLPKRNPSWQWKVERSLEEHLARVHSLRRRKIKRLLRVASEQGYVSRTEPLTLENAGILETLCLQNMRKHDYRPAFDLSAYLSTLARDDSGKLSYVVRVEKDGHTLGCDLVTVSADRATVEVSLSGIGELTHRDVSIFDLLFLQEVLDLSKRFPGSICQIGQGAGEAKARLGAVPISTRAAIFVRFWPIQILFRLFTGRQTQ